MADAAAATVLTAIWLYIIGVRALNVVWSQAMQKGTRANKKPWLQRSIMIEPFTRILERLHLFDSLQLPLGSYHMKLLILKGSDWTIERTKAEVAASVSNGYAALTVCAWLSFLAKEQLLLMIGIVFGSLLAVRPIIEAGRKVEQRKQLIIIELPEMLSKLMLLVGAGETVQNALARCLE